MRSTSASPTSMTTLIAEGHNLTRDFKAGGGVVRALRGVDVQLQPGELVALRGRSGSGKTTLLNILTGIDSPTQGQVSLLGHDLAQLNE
ncbi:MAG TPA: ATP-binding cassette domain-containing protein, partial [Ktedonobacterales bacterium]